MLDVKVISDRHWGYEVTYVNGVPISFVRTEIGWYG